MMVKNIQFLVRMVLERTAKEFEKFLGQIPINADVGKYGDMGIPIVEKKTEP